MLPLGAIDCPVIALSQLSHENTEVYIVASHPHVPIVRNGLI